MVFLPSAKEVCEGYVFTGVCLSTGGGCPGPGPGGVQAQVLGGSAKGRCLGPGPGGCKGTDLGRRGSGCPGPRGVSSPRPWSVSEPALRQTPP